MIEIEHFSAHVSSFLILYPSSKVRNYPFFSYALKAPLNSYCLALQLVLNVEVFEART